MGPMILSFLGVTHAVAGFKVLFVVEIGEA
jgi:hypothetical protein